MRAALLIVIALALGGAIVLAPKVYREYRLAHSGNVFYDEAAFDRLCTQNRGFTIAVVETSSFGRPFACVSPLLTDPSDRCLEWGGIWNITDETCSNYKHQPFGLFDDHEPDVIQRRAIEARTAKDKATP